MLVNIEPSWSAVLGEEFDKPYFHKLAATIRTQYLESTVYPPPSLLFNAFAKTPFEAVKVVILGQDPYHGPGQAHGLSFSVPTGTAVPPSLRNIYKEIKDDLGTALPSDGNLERWAAQGVLLLNATLTVNAHEAASHHGLGWEEFTDAVIAKLSQEKEHLVFLLWGRFAQEKGAHIDTEKHLVLKAAHPSPLSAYNGFFGCRHFSKTNEYLHQHDKAPIAW